MADRIASCRGGGGGAVEDFEGAHQVRESQQRQIEQMEERVPSGTQSVLKVQDDEEMCSRGQSAGGQLVDKGIGITEDLEKFGGETSRENTDISKDFDFNLKPACFTVPSKSKSKFIYVKPATDTSS